MMASAQKNTKKKAAWIIRGPLNYNMFFAILFLVIYGIIMSYSASYSDTARMGLEQQHFLKRQALFSAVGLVAMWIVSKINYHLWMKYFGWLGYALSVILLLLLKVPSLQVAALGATRWLRFGSIQFQAAEPIKLFMMVFFSMYVSRYGLNQKKNVQVAWCLSMLIAAMLLIISDNMSTAIIMLAICFVIMFVSQKNPALYVKVFFALIGAVILALLLIEFVIPYSENENFRITRIRAFMHPEDYMSSTGLQPQQALYAIGAGGFWGRGLGQSLVKFKLSEAYNDYILAIVCEELGVFGAFLVLFLLIYLLIQVAKVELTACDIEGKIFCVGVFTQIAVQSILNIMVVISWFPSTGVTLPFISYGGASVIFLLIEFGVVFNIDSFAKNRKYRAEATKAVLEEEKRRERMSMMK